MSKILVMHGPNLNMLGTREPEIYGTETLEDIEQLCSAKAEDLGLSLDFFQSNDEGALVSEIQAAKEKFDGIIINAGAYTHTSVALLDALTLFEKPVIEVHLSNIYKREEFRHISYISKIATGCICGFGSNGYNLALDSIAKLVK